MRTISADIIEKKVEEAVIKANTHLEKKIIHYFKKSLKNEKKTLPRKIISILIENAQKAQKRKTPLCQDTGLVVVFAKIGNEVKIQGKSIEKAINNGVKNGYQKGFLRKSVVKSPIARKNTKDNTPAIIHYEIIEGKKLILDILIKGGGCENKSALKMLVPADGKEGIKNFVLETVKKAGASACPPYFIGIGIGGNFEKCALLAKKALLRPPGVFSRKKYIKQLEIEILDEINKLNIGPAGLGGKTTAFSVAIEEAPCHIASLPIAVNIDCHSHRHKKIII